MKINISKMTEDDIDSIYEIEKSAYGEHHWSKDSFYNELHNNIARYFVAKNENDKIIGYLGSWFIVDEVHITTIAVEKEFRRQKVAESLLFELIDECYKAMIKYITLEVRESNEAAISLYEKFGFKSVGIRKHYYQDNNENALVMFTENIWHEKFKSVYNRLVEVR